MVTRSHPPLPASGAILLFSNVVAIQHIHGMNERMNTIDDSFKPPNRCPNIYGDPDSGQSQSRADVLGSSPKSFLDQLPLRVMTSWGSASGMQGQEDSPHPKSALQEGALTALCS